MDPGCRRAATQSPAPAFRSAKITKSDAEWRAQLTPEQYRVAREHGTERAFTGAYAEHHASGMYHCICCSQPLFRSSEKFDSGTGWPSYWAPAEQNAVATQEDSRFFARRTEVHCSACEAHLGHIFPDEPKPTGLRYCINSAALVFKKDGA